MDRDCDAFDDGAADASCADVPGLGSHRCELDPGVSGFTFETAAFFDLFPMGGTIDLDCGTIDPATGRAPCTCSVVDVPPIPVVPGLGAACVRAASGR